MLLDDKYILGDIIGQGTYAKVKIAINKFTKKKFAIKIYEKYKLLDVQRAKNLKREIAILEILQHEFIVMLHETIDTIQGVIL
jgi:serine/threonine protein kinase